MELKSWEAYRDIKILLKKSFRCPELVAKAPVFRYNFSSIYIYINVVFIEVRFNIYTWAGYLLYDKLWATLFWTIFFCIFSIFLIICFTSTCSWCRSSPKLKLRLCSFIVWRSPQVIIFWQGNVYNCAEGKVAWIA